MAKVEFFYDYSSPWTYLAFTKIDGICQNYDAKLEWRFDVFGNDRLVLVEEELKRSRT